MFSNITSIVGTNSTNRTLF